jgi:iron complex outermembrane recepter protein
MKHNRNPLAQAINYALGAGMVAGLAMTAAPVLAQDEEAADLDRVQVTGSRISRADIEGATPVTVISRQDIELSGQENVADLLRATVFNSFGSFRERSGTSFGQVALVDLRGLGSGRTALLINGRRQPGSPFTGGAAANLNSIPINAIERIEILTDSASAVYGADAIGGAINIILRSDYEGAEASTFVSRPTRSGGDELGANMVMGGTGDRGSYVFTAEWFDREAIMDADRPYSRAQFAPGDGLGVDTVGVSQFGNTAFILGGDLAGAYRAVGDCPAEAGFAGIFDYPPFPGDTACGFPYADVSAQTGGIKRLGTFLNASYELTPDHNLYMQNTFSRVRSFGRYAPAAGLFFIGGDNPANTFGEDIFLLHRFVAHGPRDDDTRAYEIDNVLGLEGRLGDIDYDFYARFFKAESIDYGTGYVLVNVIEDLVARGLYDFNNPTNPANAGAVGLSAATITRDLRNDTWQSGLTLSGFAFDMPAGPMGWAAGIEYADTRYRDIYDSYREANNVIGSAGNTASGERDRFAAFGEVLIPLLDTLEMTIAARYDDYSDFGTAFSPTIAFRYQPIDQLMLRASYGQGFRAPTLIQLNQVRSESNNPVTDLLFCEQQGLPVGECPTRQVTNFSGGNPDLNSEESESFNFGAVYQPFDGLSFTADLYRIDLDDAISQIGLGALLSLEREGQDLPAGTRIVRLPNGSIDFIETGQANVQTVRVEGWDLRADHTLNAGDMGIFNTSLQYSRIKTYDFTSLPGGTSTNLAKRFGSPSHRANLGLRWAMGDFTVNYTGRWIGETFSRQGPTSDLPNNSSYIQHDLVGVWHAPWNAEIQLGVRNLANKLPPIDPASGWDGGVELTLYPVDGRVPFLRYTQRM